MITEAQLRTFAPRAFTPELLTAINDTLSKFNIDTSLRTSYFLTQAYFETANFTRFIESLNYSTPSRLVAVWPHRFTEDQTDTTKCYAPDYTGNPEKLANLVYANRDGNGDVQSGDGWKYRGRGGFGLTGRDNYTKCSANTYGDDRLVTNPELVEAFEAGMMSAGWFWDEHKLNALADANEFTKITHVINGSETTVPERLVVLHKANLIF